MTPRHPGPRPPDFVFPFAEARGALRAIDSLIEALATCGRDHEAAAGVAGRSFEGASREAFERWLADALDQLRLDRSQLDDDAEQLRHQLMIAERSRIDRIQAQARWHEAHRRYLDAVREQGRLDGSGLQ